MNGSNRKILLLGVILVLTFALTGCTYLSNSVGQNLSGEPVATNAVSIKNFSFTPNKITISAGTEVTFTNDDSTTHTVTFDAFNSGNIKSGSSYKHTFDVVGIWNYHCSIHPSMTGQVEVK